MPEGLVPILLIIVVVVAYTVAKIAQYMRRSDKQWREVDKSKLRRWDDEEDWDS